MEDDGATRDVYDKLWGALGKQGKRWLSVAKHNGTLRALLYKGDDAPISVAGLPMVRAPLCGPPPDVTAGGRASRAGNRFLLPCPRDYRRRFARCIVTLKTIRQHNLVNHRGNTAQFRNDEARGRDHGVAVIICP